MDESITRSAGGVFGTMMDEAGMHAVAGQVGRTAAQRTTLYAVANRELETA
jgi:FO synthase